MSDSPTTVTIFSTLFERMDKSLLNIISTGSANIITLISPLCAALFTIYLLCIAFGYLRGTTSDPIMDYWWRFAGWAAILTIGFNVDYYMTYVVPFFSGLGDDISQAITGNSNPGNSLDQLATAYVTALWKIFKEADGIESTLNAIMFICLVIIFATPFMAIAAAYILLAKFSVSVLLALGPLFFAFLIFPPTRKFFDAWAGQLMNYTFLVCLFSAAGMVEIEFALSMAPDQMTLVSLVQLVLMGVCFIVIGLNLPGLASALGGGVGISSMVGAGIQAAKAAAGISKFMKGRGGGGGGGSGGSISGG